MPLNHFKQKAPAVVGSFIPSEDFSKTVHFAVMQDTEDLPLLATVGEVGPISEDMSIKYEDKDFLAAASSIEQGQLYAAAPVLFGLLEETLARISTEIQDNQAKGEEISTEIQDLRERIEIALASVTDIREASTRLLGPDGFRLIAAAKTRETGAPMITRISGEIIPKRRKRKRRRR